MNDRDDEIIVPARSRLVGAGLQAEAVVTTCVVCRHGEMRPGSATVVLRRDGAVVVINQVPARVCENCGEEYVDERVATRLLEAAGTAVRAGVRVEIRDYVAA